MPILRLSALSSLLSQLVDSTGSPHAALLTGPGGALLASHSIPTEAPFPAPSLLDKTEDERLKAWTAVGSSAWNDRRNGSRKESHPSVKVESELGRMTIVEIGSFLLILVATPVAPWPVLDKKAKLAEDVLRKGLASLNES